jgi:hypothetical protein
MPQVAYFCLVQHAAIEHRFLSVGFVRDLLPCREVSGSDHVRYENLLFCFVTNARLAAPFVT